MNRAPNSDTRYLPYMSKDGKKRKSDLDSIEEVQSDHSKSSEIKLEDEQPSGAVEVDDLP